MPFRWSDDAERFPGREAVRWPPELDRIVRLTVEPVADGTWTVRFNALRGRPPRRPRPPELLEDLVEPTEDDLEG
jgi:hypothetical protein